jgi:polyisoprenoid-binding protein YceI
MDCTSRQLIPTSLASTLAVLAAIAWGPGALAQTPAPPLAINTAKITIAGTSNAHDYTAVTTDARVTRVQFGTAAAGDGFWDDAQKPGGLTAFELSISAASLRSPRDGVDKNMHKALKVTEHPNITFSLNKMAGGPGALKASGTLRVAGVERPITLPLTTSRRGAHLVVAGAIDLLMPDFGIAPPKAMMGMVKAAPKVTVTFEVVLAAAAGTIEVAAPASVESGPSVGNGQSTTTAQPPQPEAVAASPEGDVTWLKRRPQTVQYYRQLDQRGVNVFETTKEPGVEYTGFKLDWGAAFASQVQHLSHSNTATPNVVAGVDANELADIGFGFNNSTANLYLNSQLAKGIRVELAMYLSARHHNETWVKGGYVQIDESPIDYMPLNLVMQLVTVRVGHMEINYGDAHFRRTDNGHAVYNAFVGNYILDAFTTEIGAEVYAKLGGVIAMGAVTGGEIRGTVLSPGKRSPTWIGKLGMDRQVKPNLRVRLTGSLYRNQNSLSNTLYGGDRAGSRYYYVLENTAAVESAQFTSGNLNPGFRNEVTAMQINPFVKFGGLELFGVIERTSGKAATELTTRKFNQQAVDVIYRFAGDALQVGVRYNRVKGLLAGQTDDIEGKRVQVGGGWFVTPALLVKGEYVSQKFTGYPPTNIRNGGQFKGLMLEGVVAF